MVNCQFCGKELKNQGAKNLHELKCSKNPEAGKKKEKDHSNCECSFRFLNPNIRSEYNAMMHGYKEVCTKCQELR